MEFRSGDDLCEFLHIRRLDIDYIEALILDVEVPQIYPEVIATDKCLSITVDRNAVDVVCMRVRVRSTRDSCRDGIVMGKPGEFESCSILERDVGIWPGRSSAQSTSGRIV